MNYISLVDQIISDARNKLISSPIIDEEEFNNVKDYLRLRIDCMLEEIEDEMKDAE